MVNATEPALPNLPKNTGDIKKVEIMGTRITRTEHVPKYKMLRRFRRKLLNCCLKMWIKYLIVLFLSYIRLIILIFFPVPPAKCLQVHESYRIDWCNYCYCNNYNQRVCTDWKCSSHGNITHVLFH